MTSYMTDKKLCVAIPTYNNSDNIKKKIENEASVFAKYDIDIHVFDSSADDTTKIITEKIQRQTGCIIYYTQLDSDVPSNEKVFRIFEWAAKSEYKYVWMIHDHTVCNEDSVKYLLDVLDSDYVKFARAKGLSETKVIYKHALRNAVNPMVTLLGFEFASLLSGAALTEYVFQYPGLGRLILEAVMKSDINLVMASLMIGTIMLITGNLLADILLKLVDPRMETI